MYVWSLLQAQKRKLGLLDTEEDEELSQLAKDASKRSLEFDKRKKPRVSETVSPQGTVDHA